MSADRRVRALLAVGLVVAAAVTFGAAVQEEAQRRYVDAVAECAAPGGAR